MLLLLLLLYFASSSSSKGVSAEEASKVWDVVASGSRIQPGVGRLSVFGTLTVCFCARVKG